MAKPIPDKAEVAVEYPDKLYIGTFEQSARFDAHLDETGISLSLHRTGADDVRKSVRMHFHYGLFADILRTDGHAKPIEVCIGQLSKNLDVDVVLGKTLRVHRQADSTGHSGGLHSFVGSSLTA